MSRELTAKERRGIKKLVTSLCANYDKEYGCLPLECDCYMLGKWRTGSFCRYFEQSVLPVDPVLEASVKWEDEVLDTRPCAVCGRAFIPNRKQRYCSDTCVSLARLERQRKYMQKKRVES